MTQVRQRLFSTDPYADFDATRYPTDFQGWASDHPFFEKIIGTLRPAVIIEVGSWKGCSAIHMAKLAQRIDLATEIVCVDTWLGSPEHFLDKWHGWKKSLNFVNGYPTLYYTFLSNVVASALQDVITPFPMSSENAAIILADLGVKADLIYIDAAHEYEPALRDMKMFWPLLSDNGIMVCDDYGYCEVTGAACHFAASVERPLFGSWGKAIISKKKDRIMTFTIDRLDP